MRKQSDIDRICEYRGLPKVKKGWRCEVSGKDGAVIGATNGANLLVCMAGNRATNCHPYHKMRIWNDEGELVWESEDLQEGES